MGNLIDRIIGGAIRNRRAVVVATLLLVVAGIWAFMTLTTNAFPDLTPNAVEVMTTVPNLSPVETEQQVTYPMEIAMLGLPNTRSVRSISKVGLSVVTVTFDDNVDLYFARNLVQQRMQGVTSQLPAGAEALLGPPATPMGEVFKYLVTSDSAVGTNDTLALIGLTKVQDYTIKPLLRTVPGVADVNTGGWFRQQFEVDADPTKLAGYGLTLQDIHAALDGNNANFGAGYVEDRGERFTIRGLGRLTDSADVANVVIATRGATPVRVRDVAQVAITTQPAFGAVTRDGKGPAVSGSVLMLKGANGREVVDSVMARLAEIAPLLPRGVHVRPFYNQGDVVTRTTHTVFRNLLEGALLVILVLFVFLRSGRASLLTASVIPLSLLVAFLAMKASGLSANLMSLGALDFGLIVDASVVMVENFVRRINASGADGGGPAGRLGLVQQAAFEVGRPIVFGVAIIVAVYVPIFTLQGIEGRMFRPMAFTVCAAVLGSLVLALTYIPAVASYVFAGQRSGGEAHQDARWFVALRGRYDAVLTWALAHRLRVVAAAVGLLAIAVASVPFLGTEFMPKLDEGSLLVEMRLIPSISLPEAEKTAADLERTLERFPEVKSVVTNLGRPHEATETMALNEADVYVAFNPKSMWKARSLGALIPQMDSALAQIPGISYSFSAPMAMRLDEITSGVKTDLGIKIYGDSLPLLQEKAAQIRDIVAGVRGAEDPSVATSAGTMQIELVLDHAAMARYGLTVADVQDAVQTGIGGMPATEIIRGRQRYPVVVRLASPFRSTSEAIAPTLIRTPAGGTVTLSQVARVRMVQGPEVINHDDAQRYVVVQSNVRGRDLGSFVAAIQKKVAAQVTLPSGYRLVYSGQFENQQRATKRLELIVPLVLLIIAGLLYASFGTVRHALLVMLNVPFALVGGIGALWLRGIHLNLSASVGFIALFGVAVLNGVVLIAYMNQLHAQGLPLERAVHEGASIRLRPVLMTALVASIGFIPMATSTSAGAEVQRPLASVVIGGLVTATLLTLVVLPTVYAWMEERAMARRSISAS
ncbi:MAG: efflux RND transporter permease subunit [Gemmatimonadaceae bacterium]